MNPALEMSAASLLQHEPFVRAVVRGLIADENGVQDVLQETWLRALRHPPRAGASLRAWLARVAQNLAKDSHRAAGRRRTREQAAARPEGIESVAVSYERLVVQREVVDVVLALEEPYKSVVLLRYFQNLAPVEIARQVGRSPATVRSQLSRAHEVLRAALDSKYGGERSSWAGLLAPLASEAPLLDSLAKLWASTSVRAGLGLSLAGAAACVLIPIWLRQAAVVVELQPAALEPLVAATSVSPALASPAPAARAGVSRRLPVPAPAVATIDSEQHPQLDSLSLAQLFDLAVQTQREIERQVLTPDEGLVARNAALLALPQTGICTLSSRSIKGTTAMQAGMLTRGGGAYYSFARRDHSYDAEPDLGMEQGQFYTGFYGIQLGLLIELGDLSLADLPASGEVPPFGLTESALEAWPVFWGRITLEDAAHESALRERTRPWQHALTPTGTNSTFLLRMVSPGEHDHLVAFRPLELEEGGCTLAWRILETWPIPGEAQAPHVTGDPYPRVPAGPTWLAELSPSSLLEQLRAIRAEAHGRLLEVPKDVQARYAKVVGDSADSFAQRDSFARILRRGEWDPLVEERGGGAYYSFLTRSNSYDRKPELGLQEERYSSGFSGGDRGLLFDLGEVPFDQLAAVMSGEPPSGASARERETLEFLRSVRAMVGDPASRGRRALSEADRKRAEELGLSRSVPALVGHTYLLRSVLFDDHDHLVVFSVIGADEAGHSLAFRILRSWPVEQSPIRR